MESFSNCQIREYAAQASLVSGNQFAYKKCSSCNVALIRLVDQWKWAIDSKCLSVAVFLDLHKAFDVVNHKILSSKLEMGGTTGIAYYWFESNLKGRKQFVVCKGLESDTMGPNYGVPLCLEYFMRQGIIFPRF